MWDFDTTDDDGIIERNCNGCFSTDTYTDPQTGKHHPPLDFWNTTEQELGFKIGIGIQLFFRTMRYYGFLFIAVSLLSLYALATNLSGDKLCNPYQGVTLHDDCDTYITRATIGNIDSRDEVIGQVHSHRLTSD